MVFKEDKPKLFVAPTTFEGWIDKYLNDLAAEFLIPAKKIKLWKELLAEDNMLQKIDSLEKAVKSLIKESAKSPTYAQLAKKITEFNVEEKSKDVPSVALHTLSNYDLENWVKSNYAGKYEEAKRNITVSWMVHLLRAELFDRKEEEGEKVVRDFFQEFDPDFRKIYGVEMKELAQNGFAWYAEKKLESLKKLNSLAKTEQNNHVSLPVNNVIGRMFSQKYGTMGSCLRKDLKRFYQKELKN